MSKTRVFTLAYYTLLFGLLVWTGLSLINYVDDDAYIHFRIAENFLKHGQPYFNPGDPVMASSSSGWTLTLYLLFLIFGINLKAVAVFNALVTALDVYVYARIVGALSDWDGIASDFLAFVVCVPSLVYSSAGLMETPLAMLLLGIGVLLYLRGRPVSFLFMAVCVFFRPELAVFLVLFAVHSLYKKKIQPMKMLAFTAAGAAPFVYYGLHFFGTIIPHSVIAKKAVYQLAPSAVLQRAFPEVVQTIFFLPIPVIESGKALELVLMLWLSVLAVAGAFKDNSGQHGILPLFMGSGVAVLIAYLLNSVFISQWYFPIYLMPVFLGIFVHAINRKSIVYWMLAVIVFSPFVFDFGRTVYASASDRSAYPYFIEGARTSKYLEVADRLRNKYNGYTLLSSEIGGLGYGFKGYVYDACGLASEGSVKYHPMGPGQRPNGAIGAIPPGYVQEVKPDIIVSYGIFDQALVRSGALKDYVAFKEDVFTSADMNIFPGDGLWGSKALNIYIRHDKYSGAF